MSSKSYDFILIKLIESCNNSGSGNIEFLSLVFFNLTASYLIQEKNISFSYEEIMDYIMYSSLFRNFYHFIFLASDMLGLTGAILNLLSWFIFFREKNTPMRRLLRFLSINEIGYCFTVVIVCIHLMILDNFETTSEFKSMRFGVILSWILYAISALMGYTCVLIRNWTVVLIAFARWEAIRYPLKPKKICDGKSLLSIFILITTLCFSWSFLCYFQKKYVVCLDNGYRFHDGSSLTKIKYLTTLIFTAALPIIQGLSPLICLTGFGFALIYEIRMHNRHSRTNLISAREDRQKNSKKSKNNNRSPNEDKVIRASEIFKTRVVLILSFVFLILETPACILNSLLSQNLCLQCTISIILISEVTELLMLIDSSANFFVYATSDKGFQRSIKKILTCKKTWNRMHGL